MLSILVSASLIGLSAISSVSAAPFSFDNNPLGNGFPVVANPSQQLTGIEVQAHGTLPNGPPPPTKPSDDSLTSLKLIAFNELSEVAFFTELIANLTANHNDYHHVHDNGALNFIVNALEAVQAQEELHLLNANGALAHFGLDPIKPCKYNFPVNNFEEALALASTFTDVVLGTLQDVQTLFGTDGDVGLIRGVGSVIGQEGEQNGYYRTLLGKNPSALPFLTTSTREFAFSALQGFTVPGSCPSLGEIPLQIFEPLAVVTSPVQPKNHDLTFSITIPSDPIYNSYKSNNYAALSITYINQQNTPVNVPIKEVQVHGNTVQFEANFPFDEATKGAVFGNGLTIAAVTNSTGPFASADAVAKNTVFGPGLIEIN
jgi:hypothetical protein